MGAARPGTNHWSSSTPPTGQAEDKSADGADGAGTGPTQKEPLGTWTMQEQLLRAVTMAPHLGFVGSGRTLKGHLNIPKGLHLLK